MARTAQDTSVTNQCHDITVFPTRKLAAGACSGNGIIFDISDPSKPRRIDVVSDPGFAYWHSATFNNDGTKVLFTDEWGGGGRPRCRNQDRRDWGADAIYDIVDGRLDAAATYKLPRPRPSRRIASPTTARWCPFPAATSWSRPGTRAGCRCSISPTAARRSRSPISTAARSIAKRQVLGGYWSAYYYRGRIYGTEIARGLDVFALKAERAC